MTGRNFCDGVTVDGRDCGQKVPSTASGVRLRTRCRAHRHQTFEERQARRRRREEREARAAERQQNRDDGVLG